MSGERVLRNTSTTKVALALAICCLIAAAITVRYAIAHSPGSSKTLEDQWVLTALLLAFFTYLTLLWRTRVIVTEGSPTFVIKNMFRTHRIAWSDVESFTERRALLGGGRGGRSFVVKVRLRDGRQVRCTGLGGVGSSPRELCRQLESLRIKETA